jgi:hypothetical protein
MQMAKMLGEMDKKLKATQNEMDKRIKAAAHMHDAVREVTVLPKRIDKIVGVRSAGKTTLTSHGGDILKLVVLAVIVAITASQVHTPQLKTYFMDVACSPVMPGSLLLGDGISFIAPWWAPESLKKEAFVVCGDRPRFRLTLTEGRLSAFLVDGNGSRLQWTRPAINARVGADKIIIFDSKDASAMVEPPWCHYKG